MRLSGTSSRPLSYKNIFLVKLFCVECICPSIRRHWWWWSVKHLEPSLCLVWYSLMCPETVVRSVCWLPLCFVFNHTSKTWLKIVHCKDLSYMAYRKVFICITRIGSVCQACFMSKVIAKVFFTARTYVIFSFYSISQKAMLGKPTA